MAEAEQQVDVGRPRTDAVNGGESGVGLLGGRVGQCIKVEPSTHRGGYGAQRPDLRTGHARLAEPRRPCAMNCVCVHFGKRRFEPQPDGVGAGDRKLLAGDDAKQPRQARLPPPQRQCASYLRNDFQPPVALDQIGQPLGEIVRRVECAERPRRY
jgi:hypothetical protein